MTDLSRPTAPLPIAIDPSRVSFVPERFADPAAAHAAMARDGAAILTGRSTGRDDAVTLAHDVLAHRVLAVPEPVAVREKGGKDRTRPGLGYENLQPAHTDGYAYGDHYPDVIFLLCAAQSAVGGESFLVDGYRLIEELASGDDLAKELHELLTSVPIDQTEPGFRPSVSTAIQATPAGRTMFRRTLDQRADPSVNADEAARQNRLITTWHQLIEGLSPLVAPCKLAPGEALCIDNYRMLHGRYPFSYENRFMWRIWAWTSDGIGLPDGMLHSDSRYAVIEAS
jgi:alpha-ketoglutarate-dependent taurine dioxygenase